MKSLSFCFLRCTIFVLCITFYLDISYLHAIEKSSVPGNSEIASMIQITGTINKEPLGINFKIEEYASAFVEFENKSAQNFSIGDNMYILADGNSRFNTALLMSPQIDIPQDEIRKTVSLCFVNNLSLIKPNGIIWAFGPGGDWLRLTGLEKTYQGLWSRTMASNEKVYIKHRLATWPGSDRGWLATPIFTPLKGESFRILAQFGSPDHNQQIVVPLNKKSLQKLSKDDKLPDAVRIWVVYWLESIEGNKK